MKKKFYSEAAYFTGLLILACGTALMERADFGMSMVVAPAYLLHLKLVGSFVWFTFGVAEYTLQAVLLLAMIVLLRRFRIGYLFSFVTAVLYGVMLDLVMLPAALLPETVALRVAYYLAGMMLCSLGVALLFHTYIAPEVYELFVKEWAEKYQINISKCKTIYDCISCGVGILLSFQFFGFGHFEGVKFGTIVCALCNGWLIGKISKAMETRLDFVDLQRREGMESR